jgi:hypothetical protein
MIIPEGYEGYEGPEATMNREMLEELEYELPAIPINEETTTPYNERHPQELEKVRKKLEISEENQRKLDERMRLERAKKIHTRVKSFKDDGTKQTFKTGQPITVGYLHGTESAPDMGERFGQDIEPAGRYLNITKKDPYPREGMEVGNITFQSPLILEWNAYGQTGWKQVLSNAYGGLTGKELSQAIRDDGFDAIITVDKSPGKIKAKQFVAEVVDLTMFKQRTREEIKLGIEESLQNEEIQKADEALSEDQEVLEDIETFEREQKAEETAPVDPVQALSPLASPVELSLVESEEVEEINYLLPTEQAAARKDLAEERAKENFVEQLKRETEQELFEKWKDEFVADTLTEEEQAIVDAVGTPTPAESELMDLQLRLSLNNLSKSTRGRVYPHAPYDKKRMEVVREKARGERAVINERIKGLKKTAAAERKGRRKIAELNKRIKKMQDKINDVLAQREEDILQLKINYEQRIEQLKLEAKEKIATQTKQRINAIKQKFEERKNLRAAIRELEELRDMLPKKIRGDLRGFGPLTNIVSAEKQRAFLDKAALRVEELLDNYTLRQNQQALSKLVKKILKMKRLPKEMEIFQDIRKYGEMFRDDAVAEAEKIQAQKRQLEREEVEKIFLLKTFGGKLNPKETIGFTGVEMRLAREEAEYIIRERRHRMKNRMELDQFRRNRLRELAILEMIKPDDRVLTQRELDKMEQQRGLIKRAIREVDDWAINRHSGLEMLLDNLKIKDARFTGFFQDNIVTPVFQAQMRTEMMNRSTLTNLGDFIIKEIAPEKGVTRKGKILQLVKAWSKKTTNHNIFYVHNGRYGKYDISKWEAITMWMQWQDSTLRPTFDKMKINEDTIANVEDFIGEDGINIGKYLLEQYKVVGQNLRKTVANVDNYIIPILDNYSPVSRIVNGEIEDDSMTLTDMEQTRKVSEKNRSLIFRTKNTNELAFKPANEVFAQHTYQMNHYLNFARIAKDMRAIFGNQEVRRAVNQRSGGGEAMKLVDGIVDDILRGGIDRAKYDAWANAMIRNLAVSKLSLNMTSALKQLGSIPAYANEMPAKDWVKYTAEFWADPAETAKTLWNTDYIRNRLSSSYDRDLRNLAKQSTEQAILNLRNWRDRLMFLTRYGDVGAIILGGGAYYNYIYDQQMAKHGDEVRAKAVAEQKFAEATDRAQQSSQTFAQGYWQRGGSFVKLFTMFMTTPIQYHRITWNAVKAAHQGRISWKEAGKTVFIFHVLLPQIFTAMGSAFIGLWSDDDDEVEAFWNRQKAALAVGNLNSIFMFGEGISALGSLFFEEDVEFMIKQSIPILDEIGSLVMGGYKFKEYFMGDQENDDLAEGIDNMASGLLSFFGIPYDPIKTQLDGLWEYATGETDHPWLRAMGYSDYAIFEDDE